MRTVLMVLSLGLSVAAQNWPKPLSGTFVSPDRAVKAEVKPAGDRDRAEYESQVLISRNDGALLTSRNFSSRDHSHGYGVVQAQWTSDSQFFVFCVDSSGGHSPTETPVIFYSRKLNRFLSLDDLLENSVGFAHFELKLADTVSVTLTSGNEWSGSLSKLIRTHSKKPVAGDRLR